MLGPVRIQQIVPVGDGQVLLQEDLGRYGSWRFLAPTCIIEVVIGSKAPASCSTARCRARSRGD